MIEYVVIEMVGNARGIYDTEERAEKRVKEIQEKEKIQCYIQPAFTNKPVSNVDFNDYDHVKA